MNKFLSLSMEGKWKKRDTDIYTGKKVEKTNDVELKFIIYSLMDKRYNIRS